MFIVYRYHKSQFLRRKEKMLYCIYEWDQPENRVESDVNLYLVRADSVSEALLVYRRKRLPFDDFVFRVDDMDSATDFERYGNTAILHKEVLTR